jgi:hypothetical protein
MSIKTAIKHVFSVVENSGRVYKGFKHLKSGGRTPDTAYTAMKRLFVLTNGRSNDILSKLIRKTPYRDIPVNGVLGLSSKKDVNRVVQELNDNGYYIFQNKLPESVVNSITEYARRTPCKYRIISDEKNSPLNITFSDDVYFDEANPRSPVYQYSPANILASPDLQRLVFDESLLSVAQQYLQTRPVMDLVAMWWSVPFLGKGKSESAQMYHFDLDRIKFLKFFFYLTDVDEETGPHCYVKGSHKQLPASVNKQGRITDNEVLDAFGPEKMLELCGKKGTIMAVDTRGLHKGKDLTRDKRLLFQIEFANSMFGQYYPPAQKPPLPTDLSLIYARYEDTYKEIMLSQS